MKIVILAGGFGSRLAEFTKIIPKPMVKVGKYPIIIHIMNHYLAYGYNEFIIAAGYKANAIKKYFKKFRKNGEFFETKVLKKTCRVNIVDTGLNTMTGGRLKKVGKYLMKDETFMFTYGDGISNVNLKKLSIFHKKNKKLITVTAVRPPARFGEIIITNNKVKSFKEKPQVKNGWINGGYFITNKKFLSYIKGNQDILEKKPLELAVKNRQLSAYKHHGFWKCMDVKRDRDELNEILKKKFLIS